MRSSLLFQNEWEHATLLDMSAPLRRGKWVSMEIIMWTGSVQSRSTRPMGQDKTLTSPTTHSPSVSVRFRHLGASSPTKCTLHLITITPRRQAVVVIRLSLHKLDLDSKSDLDELHYPSGEDRSGEKNGRSVICIISLMEHRNPKMAYQKQK